MGVGDAQQRFGQAHHRDALVRAEVVGVEERVDARRLVRADGLDQRPRSRRRLAKLVRVQPRLRNALLGDQLLVRPVSATELCPVDCRHRRSRGYPSCPWQCLYFLPDPQGHGALRLTGDSTTFPSLRCGSGGRGMLSNGGRLGSSPRAAASRSAVSSSAEKGSRCWVMKSGNSGRGAGSKWICAFISFEVTSSRIATSSRSNRTKASCLYSSIVFF